MLHIVIPAYNEESRLPRTLHALRRHVVDRRGVLGAVGVVVVDNASTDRTAEAALAASTPALPVRVVACPERGKGAAVRAGLLATDAELVAFMDADGATALDALDEACRRVQLGADAVIGSPRPRRLRHDRPHLRHPGGGRRLLPDAGAPARARGGRHPVRVQGPAR
ncbi:glycosyltransferase [Nocardioides sp. TF02-7]|uniref:glycosyltransferase n=1 Tax=Nocardioides sp. TF02-7 TaxID=2917724 RepID=UPI001F05CEA3|nr:glycosyltransferase [Nocardioides sp. TF02-7]UMG92149.1 glycosyltransferase [Nocardioides sp. TF02-7]